MTRIYIFLALVRGWRFKILSGCVIIKHNSMMEALRSADAAALKFLNGLTGRSVYLDAVFIFLAVYFIFILAGAHFLFFWRARRLDLWLWSAAIAAAAYLTKPLIGLLRFRFRPFVMDGVNRLIDKTSVETSFPSGHTLIVFALAFGIFWLNRRWGAVFLLGAFVVGISRVIVGVHYPSDVAAGIIIAFVLSWLVKRKLKNDN